MKLKSALLYTALCLVANAAAADTAALEALREGDMRKLIFHGAPKDISQNTFVTDAGGEATLQDYKGKVVLVDFWASWCGPCIGELPNMKKNLGLYGDKGFTIVGINKASSRV